jgi:di/tripeptidase
MYINQKRLVEDFIMLAKIKSYSGQEKEVASTLFTILEQIGSSVKSKSTEESSFSLSIDNTGNIYALLPGNTDGLEPVMLCCNNRRWYNYK